MVSNKEKCTDEARPVPVHMPKTPLSQHSGKAVLRHHNQTGSQECEAYPRKEGEEPSRTHIPGPKEQQCSDQDRSETTLCRQKGQGKSAAFRPADGKVKVHNPTPFLEVTMGPGKLSTAFSALTSFMACHFLHPLPASSPRDIYLTFNLTKEITEKKVAFLFSSSLDRFPQELKGKIRLFSPKYWQIQIHL